MASRSHQPTTDRPLQLRDLAVEYGPALDDEDLPRVSVVIANLDGWTMLEESLPALFACDYPAEKLEVLIVDNGSIDGSPQHLAEHFPGVRVLQNDHNTGFSVPCNQGAAAASDADVLVFLNNDVRVEAQWLRELVSPIARGECQSTASKMLSWDGKLVDNAGGGCNWQGIAIAHGYQTPPADDHDFPRKCLFACGGATAVDAQVFAAAGGFDEEFFAYYEDLDLGWRLWVLGHEIHYVPSAVCYHHHSGTTRRFPQRKVRVLQARNPFLCCVKNYSDENFRRVFPMLMALGTRRMWIMAQPGDISSFRIEAPQAPRTLWRRLVDRVRGKSSEDCALHANGVADLIAINDLLGNWEHWMERRKEVQLLRKRSDAEIFGLFLKPLWCVEGEPAYVELQAGMLELFGVDGLFDGCSITGEQPRG